MGRLVVLTLLLALAPSASWADDAYLRGYVGAVVEREFDIAAEAVTVENGVVTVRGDLSESDLERLRLLLRRVEGVREVLVREADTRPRGITWLPRAPLFAPLIADPRWPKFSAGYQRYLGDDELGNVGVANFGEHLRIARYSPSYGGSWDIGLQGGVFAIFDFDRDFDLVNADYVAGLPITYATGNLAWLVRVFHQSSHLGDEYLLRNPGERVNLSYEAVHTLLSYELPFAVRLYGGGAYIFRIEPSGIDRWRVQTGAEYVAPSLFENATVRPLIAVDVQVEQEGGWKANVAPVAGFQFERRNGRRPYLQMLFHYFNGRSPNGQFYERSIEYIGLTFAFHF